MRSKKKFSYTIMARIVAIILLCSCVLTSCGGPSNQNSGTNKPSGNETPYDPVEIKSNGEDIRDYTIVYSANAGEATKYAAEILSTYINKSVGSTLPIVKDDTPETDFEIVIGRSNRGISKSYDITVLGQEGYHIKSSEEKMFILGNDSRGLIYGVYDYLYRLGYRFYTKTVEKIPGEEDVFVPANIDEKFVPPFIYREIIMDNAILDAEFAVRCGINSGFMRSALKNNKKYGGFAGFAGPDKLLVHTMSTFLPESLFSAHPEYFALYNGTRTPKQPCLTSEGALEVVYSNVKTILDSNRIANMISVSLNDNHEFCYCDNCVASYENYGASGTLLNFVNEIAERVERDYPDRKLYVETLSYGLSSQDTPKGVVPHDNVIMRVCTDMCNIHTNDCEELEKAKSRIQTWSSISKTMFIWNYIVSYQNHYTPIPNFDTIYYNTKFFYENNAKAIYYEGWGRENGEFPELRTYLLSKLAFNPAMTYSEYLYHMQDFCYGYYGEESGEKILEYINYIKEVAVDYCNKTGGEFDVNGLADKFLPFEFDEDTHEYDLEWINHCQELFDEAEAAADDEQILRVQKSRIHLTFTELFFTFKNRYKYGTAAERDELVERNRQLYISIKKFGTWNLYREKTINQNKNTNDIDEFRTSPATW